MVETDYLSECRDFYERYLIGKFGNPVGASADQIFTLEDELGLTLPLAHRQYLLWMGNDTNGALKGSEWFLKDLLGNIAFLGEFLRQNGVSYLEDRRAICFFSHQGYMAAWYYYDPMEPDPYCKYYSEASSEPVSKDDGRFSEFLLKELRGIAEAVIGKREVQ